MSQESRIAFARQFRLMSQDNVSDKLGLKGECKRRTMTRYEKGDRNPKADRTKEIANILNVSYNSIKKYDFNNLIDVFYILMWLEELIPKYQLDLSKVPNINDKNILLMKSFLDDWDNMRNKRNNKEISYHDYIEWKLTYEVKNL